MGELVKSSEAKPWEVPTLESIVKSDFPSRISLTRANMLYIPLNGISAKVVNHLKRIAAFHNPEFYARQGMRLSTYDVSRIISCSELSDGYIAMPRGCEDDVTEVLQNNNVAYVIKDHTNHGKVIDVAFKGKLREEQQKAMECMLSHNIGTLSATTAFGKTIFAIAMIAQRKVNTLILVHRKSQLDQWKKQLEELQKLLASDTLVIVATGKYIGEGFDYPRLDTLFLVLPISWKGNVAQYSGRLHRDYEGKHDVCIYDYVDIRVPLCDSMYRKRLKGYASVGYGVLKSFNGADILQYELIYDGLTFAVPFRRDLLSIKHSIVISCQKVRYKYTPRFVSQLRDLLVNGIEAVVHIKEQGYNENDLINSGIEVLCNQNLSIQCSVIDKSIVWYGNIDFFGYNKEDNNAMRIEDSTIANELLDVIYGSYEKNLIGI